MHKVMRCLAVEIYAYQYKRGPKEVAGKIKLVWAVALVYVWLLSEYFVKSYLKQWFWFLTQFLAYSQYSLKPVNEQCDGYFSEGNPIRSP